METGFVQEPDGKIYPLEWCDFKLYQHGENGNPPKDHGFQFKAGINRHITPQSRHFEILFTIYVLAKFNHFLFLQGIMCTQFKFRLFMKILIMLDGIGK